MARLIRAAASDVRSPNGHVPDRVNRAKIMCNLLISQCPRHKNKIQILGFASSELSVLNSNRQHWGNGQSFLCIQRAKG